MENEPALYNQVVKITQVYLGPTAERFISRQVRNHLHKLPKDLTKNDLSGLIDWIKMAISLLTEDSDIVEEYTEQLMTLLRSSDRHNRSSQL